MNSKSKFWQWIDHKVKVTISDKRIMVGNLMGFDKHLNLVLADTEEFRILKPKKIGDPIREIKRPMGLLILRGDNVISITALKAPDMNIEKRMDITSLGPGKSQAITRPVNFDEQQLNNTEIKPQNMEGLGVPEEKYMNQLIQL